jgi:small subunit ribosomal protein S16
MCVRRRPPGSSGFSPNENTNKPPIFSHKPPPTPYQTTQTKTVAIRFQRFGRKKSPFYRLVAIDSRVRRDGRPLEYLGWYDPLKKETNLNAPAIKQWLSVGAQPSETVRGLLKKAYVIQPDSVKVEVPKVEL